MMAKKRIAEPSIKAVAKAKAEVVAKATYQRKHSTTAVVPPDVTRAKASAWLDLISPITEWAGLKGDALNFQRHLLRIQQEETLLRVAKSVQQKMEGEEVSSPVPRKILVPALEKASLEDVADDVMIDRWANLLASAAKQVVVQPRFVGILEEMAGQQAECLERVAFNRFSEFYFPSSILEDSWIEFADHNVREVCEHALGSVLKDGPRSQAAADKIVQAFNRPGVILALALMSDNEGGAWELYDHVSETGTHDETNYSILESLGLIRYSVLKMYFPVDRTKGVVEVNIYYHHLTNLGFEFCAVCSRPRMKELEAITLASQAKGLKRQDPF